MLMSVTNRSSRTSHTIQACTGRCSHYVFVFMFFVWGAVGSKGSAALCLKEGQEPRDEGRGMRDEGRGTWDVGRGTWNLLKNYSLFTVHCSLFTIHYSLFAPAFAKASAGKIHYSLFTVRCSLFTLYDSLFTFPPRKASIPPPFSLTCLRI